jgi:hypothetical protein
MSKRMGVRNLGAVFPGYTLDEKRHLGFVTA